MIRSEVALLVLENPSDLHLTLITYGYCPLATVYR